MAITSTLVPVSVSSNPGAWTNPSAGGPPDLSDDNTSTRYEKSASAGGNWSIFFDNTPLPAGAMAPFTSPEFYGYVFIDSWPSDNFSTVRSNLYHSGVGETQNVFGYKGSGAAVYQRNNAWYDLQPDLNSNSPFTFNEVSDVNDKQIHLYSSTEKSGFGCFVYDTYWRITHEVESGGFAHLVSEILLPIGGLALLGGNLLARDARRIRRALARMRRRVTMEDNDEVRMLRELRAFPWRRFCFLGGA
jgi:hypothetical protein